MKPSKKIQEKLSRRTADFEATVENISKQKGYSPGSYTRPGSRNPKRT